MNLAEAEPVGLQLNTPRGNIAQHSLEKMPDLFTIRLATPEDTGAIAWQWLAIAADSSTIIGGAGIGLRDVSPHPLVRLNGEVQVAEGRHGIILNVFTEPEWRRLGVASSLLERMVDWARTERLDRLVLHASKEGRAVYERLGFVATNEMRFGGDLKSAN